MIYFILGSKSISIILLFVRYTLRSLTLWGESELRVIRARCSITSLFQSGVELRRSDSRRVRRPAAQED
jgi:hypothetical protein